MIVAIVSLVAFPLTFNSPVVHAESREDLRKRANETFLRLECQAGLPKEWTGRPDREVLKVLLNALESRTRGLTPPYDAQRCADWGYPPLDLPEVPEGWEDSPFTELIGELNMTPAYEQDLKEECQGIFPPRRLADLSHAGQEEVMRYVLEQRAEGVLARYSLKRCLDWGILPPGEKTDL